MSHSPESPAAAHDLAPADLMRLVDAIHALPEPYARQLAPLADAVVDYRPNVLTAYLFELANRYSTFFEQCPVLKAPDETTRASRLLLCDLTARTIRQGLDLLGIGVVDARQRLPPERDPADSGADPPAHAQPVRQLATRRRLTFIAPTLRAFLREPAANAGGASPSQPTVRRSARPDPSVECATGRPVATGFGLSQLTACNALLADLTERCRGLLAIRRMSKVWRDQLRADAGEARAEKAREFLMSRKYKNRNTFKEHVTPENMNPSNAEHTDR